MPVINTNVNALFAQTALRVNNRNLSSAMEQLSTGSRINSAKDDAAGVSIASTMTAQIRGLGQAVKNANDGISLLQTAEGAMVEQTNMLQRMRELAVQASTDTLSGTQKGYLQDEYAALADQIDKIGSQTQWNGMTILDGKKTDYAIGVGSNGTATETITVSIADMSSLKLNTSTKIGGTGSTSTSASDAIGSIETALKSVNDSRSAIGAGINRLTYAADNLNNVIQNATASRSQIVDTDYATATTQLARAQIIQQAATAMLAQANQSPQSVLALLK